MFYQAPSVNAPEFPKGLTWLNSEKLSLQNLRGKVILVDFWTYSCINCQRTLPYLKSWWEKYQDSGLVIIGVHTPEFEFEKDVKNVKKALSEYEVIWPVVLDNDYEIWASFTNHYWPAKYLIDSNGKIIYTHFGEGSYLETELEIQQALENAGFKVNDKLVGNLTPEGAQSDQTPELYLGSLRGNVKQLPTAAVTEDLELDQIYYLGNWSKEKEYLEHSKETKELDDLLILKYKAKKVYLVMESQTGKPIKVYATIDGVGLKNNGAGKDIKFDAEDRSYIEVNFSTLYNLVDRTNYRREATGFEADNIVDKDLGEHTLRLSTIDAGLKLFAFTFGS